MKKIFSPQKSLFISKEALENLYVECCFEGSESWTVGEDKMKSILAFETQCYRRMFKIY